MTAPWDQAPADIIMADGRRLHPDTVAALADEATEEKGQPDKAWQTEQFRADVAEWVAHHVAKAPAPSAQAIEAIRHFIISTNLRHRPQA